MGRLLDIAEAARKERWEREKPQDILQSPIAKALLAGGAAYLTGGLGSAAINALAPAATAATTAVPALSSLSVVPEAIKAGMSTVGLPKAVAETALTMPEHNFLREAFTPTAANVLPAAKAALEAAGKAETPEAAAIYGGAAGLERPAKEWQRKETAGKAEELGFIPSTLSAAGEVGYGKGKTASEKLKEAAEIKKIEAEAEAKRAEAAAKRKGTNKNLTLGNLSAAASSLYNDARKGKSQGMPDPEIIARITNSKSATDQEKAIIINTMFGKATSKKGRKLPGE